MNRLSDLKTLKTLKTSLHIYHKYIFCSVITAAENAQVLSSCRHDNKLFSHPQRNMSHFSKRGKNKMSVWGSSGFRSRTSLFNHLNRGLWILPLLWHGRALSSLGFLFPPSKIGGDHNEQQSCHSCLQSTYEGGICFSGETQRSLVDKVFSHIDRQQDETIGSTAAEAVFTY